MHAKILTSVSANSKSYFDHAQIADQLSMNGAQEKKLQKSELEELCKEVWKSKEKKFPNPTKGEEIRCYREQDRD
ncbi:hypothetical protein C0J52_09318 [Blattella germanica]|nr:hypothetical protein C0J52_09318 [Blattella germanica]